MDDRNGTTPIALTRNAPVAQAIVHPALADAHRFHAAGNLLFRLRNGQAIQEIRVDQDTVIRVFSYIGFGLDGEPIRLRSFRGDYRYDRQVILAGEIQIALVVARAAEDRA